jgi:hypothetical protein
MEIGEIQGDIGKIQGDRRDTGRSIEVMGEFFSPGFSSTYLF